jgi:hypothetical protein
VALDDASPQALRRLDAAGREVIAKYDDQLTEIARRLAHPEPLPFERAKDAR